jgi:hypothetical protein
MAQALVQHPLMQAQEVKAGAYHCHERYGRVPLMCYWP